MTSNAELRTTQAWARMETQFSPAMAATMAEGAMGEALPPVTQRRHPVTVLPRVELAADGNICLNHAGGDRYERVTVLGEGGMGIVERAEDRDIGRSVAIKRLLPQASHPLGVARFISEIRIIGSLDHPNVVPIHDVGVDDNGQYFFVMKYVEGQTLADVIDALAAGDAKVRSFWTFERRAELMIAVLQALQYAHEREILHRDIKPENIMIGTHGEVRLMDWGIAKKLGEREPGETDDLIGTPAYMSPEQAQSQELDVRSDLYSAAVTFHELLWHRHYLAEHSSSLTALLLAVQEVTPEVFNFGASEDNSHEQVPPELRHFVHRGLAKDPALRFQSAEAMIAELRRYIDGRCEVRCVFTLTKRALRESGRLVDRQPRVGVTLAAVNVGLSFIGAASLLWWGMTAIL